MLIVVRKFGYSEHISFPEFRICFDVEHLAACLPGNGAAPVVLDAVIPLPQPRTQGALDWNLRAVHHRFQVSPHDAAATLGATNLPNFCRLLMALSAWWCLLPGSFHRTSLWRTLVCQLSKKKGRIAFAASFWNSARIFFWSLRTSTPVQSFSRITCKEMFFVSICTLFCNRPLGDERPYQSRQCTNLSC